MYLSVRVAGPIMAMEMCEESLKDWLSKRPDLSTDDLEAILGFSLNIARGVEHLHSQKVSCCMILVCLHHWARPVGPVTSHLMTDGGRFSHIVDPFLPPLLFRPFPSHPIPFPHLSRRISERAQYRVRVAIGH